MQIKRDYHGGALMVVIGLTAAYASLGYQTGTPARMGPGFFPCAVGLLLAFTGLLIALSARGDVAPGRRLPDLRGGACLIAGVLAFMLLGLYGGLVPATFAIVFISALGDRGNTVFEAFMLSMAMCGIAVIVFWWALQLQLPLFHWGW